MISPATLFATLSLAAASAHAATVLNRRDVVVSTSQRVPAIGALLGQLGQKTTVASGVQYWLSGFSPHNIWGSLDNSGSIYISQTDSLIKNPIGQSVYFTGGSLANRGLIELNDVSALSAPTYNWQLDSFVNDGTIQWCGRGDTGGSTYLLQCNSASCTNNGLIVFEQVNDNSGTAAKWQALSSSPINNGGFLMREARVDFVQNFAGNGCWMIDDGATMYLQNGVGSTSSAFDGQSVAFAGGSGVLHMSTAVYSRNSTFGPQVYGFGGDNVIEFYQTISTWAYANGVLTVRFSGGNAVQIKIGSGYDASKFAKRTQVNKYGSYNAIAYSGAAARSFSSASAQCQRSVPKCSALPATGFPGDGAITTQPVTTNPATTQPATTQPATTQPATTQPATTQPATTKPATTQPATTQPVTTQPATTVRTTATNTFDFGGNSLGCFQDDAGFGGSRSLPSSRTAESFMTNAYCANYCGKLGFRYSGTEYGQECYCGAMIPATTSQNCNIACAGNNTNTCGGSWALSVYNNTAIKGSVVDPSYEALGCYLDSVGTRTLQGYSFANDNMTQAVCATQCSSRGFAFSGTEYGRECYCASYAPQVTSTQCDMTCDGSNSDICGGPNALTVLRDDRIAVVDAPSCPSLPVGYTVCKEGERVMQGKCVT